MFVLTLVSFYNLAKAQDSSYTTNAIKITPNGDVISGSSAIIGNNIEEDITITETFTTFSVAANAKYEYQIGKFTTADGSNFKQLLILNKAENDNREFEFVAPSKATSGIADKINKQREKWITLCNLNNASVLVRELYTSNSIYYNHRPVVVGHDAISKDYVYMNNPNYKLSLSPLKLEIVNETLAFEIGQCSGSYNGKYLLVWQKSKDGDWQVLVDSNI